MMLPFLKESKWPRVGKPMEEKLVNGDAEDHLEHHCMTELMDAVMNKDIGRFRAALEALVLNMFDRESKDAS
jgi:hypothetical protein